MLYYIDAKNHVLIQPDAVKLCPELAVLSEKEVVFLVLAYDYTSPFKQFPERERERRAEWEVFGDSVDILSKHSIQLGAEKYKMLQWNPKIELINTYQRKIDKLSNQVEYEESYQAIKKITETIDSLRLSITKLQNEVDTEIQNKGVIRGGASLSLLEELQSNSKYYKSVVAARPSKEKE